MTVRSTVYHQSRILNETQTYDATARCPVCGDQLPRETVAQIQKAPPIYLLACDACGVSSASRMPKAEVLDKYYSQYYSGRDDDHITFYNPERFARHILKFVPAHYFENRDSISICDFGGGDGASSIAIARLLKPRQINITLVDYVKDPSTVPSGVTIEKTNDLADVDKPHDIFLASSILEHIPEPKPILQTIFPLLKPGGYFYARTPYIVPLMQVIKRMDFCYPGHLHDMGPKFWNRLIETFSLDAKIVISRPSPVETKFSTNFSRTCAAHLLKFPALIELALNKTKKEPLWKYVGGWEILLKKAEKNPA